MAIGPRGDVFVVGRQMGRVEVFNTDGALMRAWGREGRGPGELLNPRDICVSAADEVFVADTDNHRVLVFSAEGMFVRAIGSFGVGRAPGDLAQPQGVAVSVAGELFVADSVNERVSVFRASDGAFLRLVGSDGPVDSRLGLPTAVAVSAAGEVFVADNYNRVCVFRANDGTFLRAFGSMCGEPRQRLLDHVAVTVAGELLVTSWKFNGQTWYQVHSARDGVFLRELELAGKQGRAGATVAVNARGDTVVVACRGRVQMLE